MMMNLNCVLCRWNIFHTGNIIKYKHVFRLLWHSLLLDFSAFNKATKDFGISKCVQIIGIEKRKENKENKKNTT